MASRGSFKVPLFESGTVFWYMTREGYDGHMRELGLDPADESVSGISTSAQNRETGETQYIIGVFREDYVHVLCHEAAHTTFHICRDVGVQVNVDRANETYCYLLDYIVRQVVSGVQQST